MDAKNKFKVKHMAVLILILLDVWLQTKSMKSEGVFFLIKERYWMEKNNSTRRKIIKTKHQSVHWKNKKKNKKKNGKEDNVRIEGLATTPVFIRKFIFV